MTAFSASSQRQPQEHLSSIISSQARMVSASGCAIEPRRARSSGRRKGHGWKNSLYATRLSRMNEEILSGRSLETC
jgi:hypothetical protein